MAKPNARARRHARLDALMAERKAGTRRDGRRSHTPVAEREELGARHERIPALTDALAHTFVKILMAGVPPATAVAYCAPQIETEDGQARTLRAWTNDPLMARAIASFNGGEWHELDPDKRIELALDKASAELAYYLWSHSYETATGEDLKKLAEAREALTEQMHGQEGGDTPWAKLVRDLLDGKLDASGPPQLESLPVPDVKHRN